MYLIIHCAPLIKPSSTSILDIKSYCSSVISITSCGKPPVWVIFLLEIAGLILVSNILDTDPGKMSVYFDLMQKLFVFFVTFHCANKLAAKLGRNEELIF